MIISPDNIMIVSSSLLSKSLLEQLTNFNQYKKRCTKCLIKVNACITFCTVNTLLILQITLTTIDQFS